MELSVKSRMEMLDQQIASCKSMLHDLPDGVLHVGRNGKYYNWKWVDAEGNWHYISKNDEDEAVQRALSKLYTAQLSDLNAEREACLRYCRCMDRHGSAVSRLMEQEGPEFKRLLRKAVISKEERIRQWENQSYEKSMVRQEDLIHPTMKEDLFVRSKIEAMVSGDMTILKIPHLYEKILHIDQWEIAADFTALDVRTFREIPVEVFGMMDVPEYRRIYEKKMHTYIDGGYIPGVNMLVFYEFSDAPLSQASVLDELERFFYRNPPYMH